jgi:TonB family protein
MKLASVIAVMCLLIPFSHAEDTKCEEANQLLRNAFESSCDSGKIAPYEMSASLAFYRLNIGQATGSVRKLWADRDNHTLEIKLDNYQLLVVRKDGKFYRHETSQFTPLAVSRLQRILPPFCMRLDNSDIVKKISNRRLDKVDARCILFDTVRGAVKKAHETCVQVGAGGSTSLISFKGDDLEFRWSDYESFDGRSLPRRIEIIESDIKLVEGALSYKTLSPASISVPTGMEAVRSCLHSVPPVVRKAPDPVFPVNVPRYKTKVVLEAIVGTDGSVQDSRVLESGGKSYDDSAQEAVKKWTFLPALCDGQPEQAHAQVQVNFQLR